MKNIKFVTTFSANGYQVYGKTWIESFLEKTKKYPNITAKIYVDGLDISQFNYNKIEVVDYDSEIPTHKSWVELFKNQSKHDTWNRDLGIKFSFKSFVMIDSLKKISDGYVVWLDADCVFMLDDFENWPESLLNNTFMACQREHGSEHVESGIIIFDSEHSDKNQYINEFESYYLDPNKFNNFGQFFDGYAVGRTLNIINIPYVDLNEKYGKGGIQSDPNCTFLNPEIQKRFVHNIGITGKRQYEEWGKFKNDPLFQLIHGVNDLSLEEQRIENLKKIDTILGNLFK